MTENPAAPTPPPAAPTVRLELLIEFKLSAGIAANAVELIEEQAVKNFGGRVVIARLHGLPPILDLKAML